MTTAEYAISEWLPLAPRRTIVPNGTFDVDIGGWQAGPSTLQQFSLLGTFGSLGSGTAPNFNLPEGLAVDSSGNVYVADALNHRIVKLSSAGAYVTSVSLGAASTSAIAVAVDSSGNVYTTEFDSVNGNALRKFNNALAQQWVIPSLPNMNYLATDGTHVYVAFEGNFIQKRLCSTGALVTSWGTSGSGDGQFNNPIGVATNGVHVYVSEAGNNRVQKFTTAGAFVTKWGSAGSANGQFNFPRGVALDAIGEIWVSDNDNNRLQRFSNTGQFQLSIPQANPGGVAVASGNVLWVSNVNGHNVAKWDEIPLAVTPAWDGAVGGEANGSLAFVVPGTSGPAGASVSAIGSKWYPVNGRESVEVAAWVKANQANLVLRLQILWGDAAENVLSTATEPLWSPAANEEYRRVFAAQVPGRAIQYRLGLLVSATGAAAGAAWFDDVTVNDNELIVTDVAMGHLLVTVSMRGRWL